MTQPTQQEAICSCGVAVYAPDSIAAGACYMCRKKGTEAAITWQPALPHAQTRLDWEAVWAPRQRVVSPPSNVIQLPTVGRLAGILRKVANTPKGSRQTIGFWAAGRLLDGNYPASAWDAVEAAMRSNGADDHDVRTALRERPDRRVHA